jgi:hypothetical protein
MSKLYDIELTLRLWLHQLSITSDVNYASKKSSQRREAQEEEMATVTYKTNAGQVFQEVIGRDCVPIKKPAGLPTFPVGHLALRLFAYCKK